MDDYSTDLMSLVGGGGNFDLGGGGGGAPLNTFDMSGGGGTNNNFDLTNGVGAPTGGGGGGTFNLNDAPFTVPAGGAFDPATLQTGQGAPMSTTPALQTQGQQQFLQNEGAPAPGIGAGGVGGGGAGEGAPDGGAGGPPKPDDPNFAQKAMKTLGLYDPAKGTLGPNALPIGMMGVNAYNQNKRGSAAQNQLNNLSQPARGASEQLINQGLAGDVPKPILDQFNRTFDQQKSAIEARYASMGRDPQSDSAAQKEISDLAATRDASIANYASQLLNQGLAAAQVAAGPATAAVTAGVQSDKELSNAMAQTMQQLALLQSLRSRETGGAVANGN